MGEGLEALALCCICKLVVGVVKSVTLLVHWKGRAPGESSVLVSRLFDRVQSMIQCNVYLSCFLLIH